MNSTSPSVYLQLVGTAAVSDECGAVGSTLNDPIVTLAPGALSTWKPPSASWQEAYGMSYAIGDEWEDPIALPELGMIGELAPLNIKDLACPTWGLGRTTSADGTVMTTIGSPWLPIIAPPMEAFSLDPIWALLCTGIMTAQLGANTFALYDPPIALTRASGLVPVVTPTSMPAHNEATPTTVPNQQGSQSTEAAKPASLPVDPADPPARTGYPIGDSPSPSLAVASADPARSGAPPGNSAASPTYKGNLPADPSYSDPQTTPTDPKAPAQPAPQQGDDSQPQTQGLGAIIYNAFGDSGLDISGIGNKVDAISVPSAGVQAVSIAGGQVLSVGPSGSYFEGKTYSVGGPAMTLSKKVYTLVSQHGSDDSAINDPETPVDSLPHAPVILTIAGHTMVPNPTGMIIDGSSVLPGGSAVTISGTAVSLGPSGILVVGSSSFSLPPQSVFTVGPQPFTANPTGFSFDGVTVSPGAAAQTVDGTVLSLGHSGALVIGTSSYSLPTPITNSPAFPPFTVAGQTFTPNPTAFSIAGTTISAGGSPVTLAGTIISLGESGNLHIGSSTISLPTPTSTPPFMVAGQAFTPNPSAFSIAGTIISAGGSPVTIGGTIISLGQSGTLLIGSSTISLSNPISPPSFVVAGQTFTPKSSAFSIAGTTISAGGPAITLAGTIISLQPSGTLVIGSRTIPLVPPQTPSPSLEIIDGLSVQAQSSLAIVDGVTVSPGAPGVTIDGKSVSLEFGGATLDIGTGRFAMPTGSANGSAGILAFEGGQGRSVEVTWGLLLGSGVGGVLMLMG